MADPNLTQADVVILSLLCERAMHGYDLVKEYDRQEVQEWASVSRAQVYYALKKLGKTDYLSAAAPDEEDDRGKTVYSVTAAGRDALREALRDEDWVTGRRPQPFGTWLGLSMHADPADRPVMIAKRRDFLRRSIERERESLDYVRTIDAERARLGEKLIDLAIRQFETELVWLDTVSDDQERAPGGTQGPSPD